MLIIHIPLSNTLQPIHIKKKYWGVIKLFIQSGAGRKEGNVLFNDAVNTFYLW